ncbi:MAG TPA: hypothetical protein VNE39_23280 [Planctomycetota bacterium]|nr:hypothetical protein [Planctomycetota bacterium]
MNADRLPRWVATGAIWAFLALGACTGGQRATAAETIANVDPTVVACDWLVKIQEADGSWDAGKWGAKTLGPIGATSLAILSVQSVGFWETRGRFRAQLAKGLDWLETQQRPDGSFPWRSFEEQGMATLALSEAYIMAGVASRGQAAQRGLDYICKVQPVHGGFGDRGACAWRDADVIVTAWQFLALRSGMQAKLKVPDASIQRVRDYLAEAKTAGADAAKSSRTGALGSLAAIACCRLLSDEAGSRKAQEAADLIMNRESRGGDPVEGGLTAEAKNDLYYRWFSGLTMLRVGGLYGDHWRTWRKVHRSVFFTTQVTEKEDARGRPILGSFDPAHCAWGDQGGRIFATSMAILASAVPLRFLPLNRLGWSVE